jgi:RecB family exonuclease
MTGSRAAVSELVADVDQRLALTYASLTVVRGRFRRCPDAAQTRACEVVEAQLDELLDLRLALTCPPEPSAARP